MRTDGPAVGDFYAPLDEKTAQFLPDLLAERRLILFRQSTLTVQQQMHIVGALGPVIVGDPAGNP